MSNPLISVIIPVYNVEKFLEKCVNSVLNQSYNNLEVILIDDGSIDNSGLICDLFKKKDSRVQVIHTKNFGVSHARNIGLDNVKGEFFLFLDADDYIKYNMVEVLYKNINKYNSDVSVCNVARVDCEGNILFAPILKGEAIELDKSGFLKNLYNNDFVNGYPINKLIRTKCSVGIRFDEKIKHLEDWDYLCRLSQNVEKVICDCKDYYYFYVDREDSAVHAKFNESWTTDLIAREKNIEYVSLYDVRERDRFYFDYVINALNTLGLHYYSKSLTEEEKNSLFSVRDKYYPLIKKSPYLSRKEKVKLFFKCKFPIFYFKLMSVLK